jgi:hypothetical protein
VEIADRLWEVDAVSRGADYSSGVRLKLLGPAVAQP